MTVRELIAELLDNNLELTVYVEADGARREVTGSEISLTGEYGQPWINLFLAPAGPSHEKDEGLREQPDGEPDEGNTQQSCANCRDEAASHCPTCRSPLCRGVDCWVNHVCPPERGATR